MKVTAQWVQKSMAVGQCLILGILVVMTLGACEFFNEATATSIPPTLPPPEEIRPRIIFVAGICSTNPLGEMTFGEISNWLIQDRGYVPFQEASEGRPQSEIYAFSYGAGPNVTVEDIDVDPQTVRYDDDFTTASIRDVHGPRLAKYVKLLSEKYPGEKFALIGHSMGGVVALYAAANPQIENLLWSVTTINSPVQGNDAWRTGVGPVFLPCATLFTPAVIDMDRDNEVMTTIGNVFWSAPEHPIFVATIANKCDIVVTTLATEYPGGDLGVLENADYSNAFVADPDGCTQLDLPNVDKMKFEHRAPLLVETNLAAKQTKIALQKALSSSLP